MLMIILEGASPLGNHDLALYGILAGAVAALWRQQVERDKTLTANLSAREAKFDELVERIIALAEKQAAAGAEVTRAVDQLVDENRANQQSFRAILEKIDQRLASLEQ